MNQIDVVITWVDGNDPQWIQEYNNFSKQPIDAKRFKNTGTLQYVFRGIEKFMPWVRKVHFVTYGHYPEWLNIKHSKLNIVKHEDIFPDKKDLPVFNINAIEVNFHRIKGLSEQFIYFNDDMFVLKPLSKEYFFQNNLPNDFFVVQELFHDNLFSHMLHSNMQIINKEISNTGGIKKQLHKVITLKYGIKSIIKNLLKIFISRQISLFEIYHHPQPHLKSNFIEVESLYPDIIEQTRKSKFREATDVTQYLFRFWGLIKGKFNPVKHNDACYIGVNSLTDLKKDIKNLYKQDPAFVCFNEHDSFPVSEYSEYEKLISEYLDKYLNEKSTWEK